MKQGMNSVNRYLWDVLLYACMGCFSYFFLVHYADIPVRLQDRLMTFHTFLAVIVSFCGVGLSMRYINERLLTYYPYFLRNKRMLSAGLIAAAVILLLSNYLLLVSVKALAGVASPFHLQRSGLTVILLVWLVELVIVGQFILKFLCGRGTPLQACRRAGGKHGGGPLPHLAESVEPAFPV